jgi:hypothetical protein
LQHAANTTSHLTEKNRETKQAEDRLSTFDFLKDAKLCSRTSEATESAQTGGSCLFAVALMAQNVKETMAEYV